MTPVLPVVILAVLIQAAWGSAIGTKNVGVTGGDDIRIEQANYMALIYTMPDAPCGAVIIDEEYMLTTSTCCIRTSKDVFAFVGTNRKEQLGKSVAIDKFIKHPSNLKPGLCLVKLQQKLEFNDKVGKINLDDNSVPLTRDTWAKLTAFGARNKADQTPRQLRQGWIQISDSNFCKQESQRLKGTLICAGDEKHNACFGDVGGALTIEKPNSPKILIGVVAEIPNDCMYQASRFARISAYKQWIETSINKKTVK